jgi:membrane-associated phospholipid phosphatase
VLESVKSGNARPETADGFRALKARSLATRVAISIIAVAIWFWTQSLIGARALPPSGIGDGLHNLTSGLNAYLQQAPAAANALLIVRSALIDALGLFLLGSWIFAGSVRPFLGLLLLLGLRQMMQALCALPAPPNAVWHYPGFPSLFVTYNVANDYFFSGHTGIAVFGAIELARFRRTWLTVVAIVVVIFEIATVLVLRAHYTMDVFTGILAALWVATVCDWVAPRIERALSRNS